MVLQRSFPASPFHVGSAWEGWQKIVRSYVGEELTHISDILPALSGVASRIQCEELGWYVAGL